ncbi:RNA polymerase sigma-70 factor, sigma-E family [Nocardioides scoriae]|uniref:RNA polymerase sigma-70 factor, sigma-E family n=1 Tax=Nocardioides scoriae TaxID=642780 RepID=A0A1H1M4Q1_9ACTN|nr:SigE family RNA polymerase sigma factor [Nocardioides scoriae]SDR80989.1 RNA polymerase sigma-70 factor, sigma-E family [Nocardioides scoriae]
MTTSDEARHPVDADTALERLHDAHHRGLVRLGTLLLGDPGRAEEVVQDTWVELYRRWDRVGGRVDDVAAYLRQAVVNRCRSVGRHRGVVVRHRAEPTPDAGPADEAVLAEVRRDAVLAAVARLPRRQREVVVLRYYLDLSEREIARTLGISQGAVKSHASRGSAALRARLSEHLEELR